MLIAVWGRDGTGKSTLCDALGAFFADRSVTAVIDTDLTQPTLPGRVIGQKDPEDSSLGRAISGTGISDVARYLHQHQKHKALFYAGLTDRDDCLSYELGLEADDAAQGFVERCLELAETVILDLSGQRTDPFLPVALSQSENILIPLIPDVQGVCWFSAVKPLLEAMHAAERVFPIASMAEFQTVREAEKALDLRFAAELPYVREFRQLRDTGTFPQNGSTPTAIRYRGQIQKLWGMLQEKEA